MMTSRSKLIAGITVLTVPTIIYGGYFLLTILAGADKTPLTSFRMSMLRAGHAHAGVLVILSLVMQLLIDNTGMNSRLELALRIAFPLSAIAGKRGLLCSRHRPRLGAPQPNDCHTLCGCRAVVCKPDCNGCGIDTKQIGAFCFRAGVEYGDRVFEKG